jgi:hypothetical protein
MYHEDRHRSLLDSGKEVGPEENAEMFTYRHQNVDYIKNTWDNARDARYNSSIMTEALSQILSE